MSHPLDGCNAKIRRSSQHFEELKAEIAAASEEAKTVRFGQKFYPESNTIRVTVDEVPAYPEEWALIAADAVQNLRSALNYLTWELAKWNLRRQRLDREPEDRTQFPIAEKPGGFNRSYVADLHPDHVAKIEWLQPYGDQYGPQIPATASASEREARIATHPLLLLQKLSNTDKHRLLRPLVLGAGYTKLGPYVAEDCEIINTAITPHVGAFQKGAEWVSFTVIPGGPNPKVKVDDKYVPRIAFEGSFGVENTIERIGSSVTFIAREFESVF